MEENKARQCYLKALSSRDAKVLIIPFDAIVHYRLPIGRGVQSSDLTQSNPEKESAPGQTIHVSAEFLEVARKCAFTAIMMRRREMWLKPAPSELAGNVVPLRP
jgi:hypothetical protein